MNAVRFTLWCRGVRVCDLPFVGGPMMAWAVWFERHTPWEWPYRLTGCGLFHPEWLLPTAYIPDAWWDRMGWRKD